MRTAWLSLTCLGVTLAACNETSSPTTETSTKRAEALSIDVLMCAHWEALPPGSGLSADCSSEATVPEMYAIAVKPKPGFELVSLEFHRPTGDGKHDPATVEAYLDLYRQLSAVFKEKNASANVVANTADIMMRQLEGYRESQVRAHQEREGAIDAVIDGLESDVLAKLDPARAAEQAKLADFRQNQAKVDPVIGRARDRLATISGDFKVLARRHVRFLATEDRVFRQLQDIATRGSSATIQTLGAVQEELIALERAQAPACFDFSIETARLAARIGYVVQDYQLEIQSMIAFLKTTESENVIPDAADKLTEAVLKLASYCESRQARFKEAYGAILEGLKQRSEALVQQAATAATQKVLSDARFLRSSQSFLVECTARSAQLSTLPKTSQTLKLPYLLPKYQEHEANLMLEPMCAESALAVTSWMDAGCEVIKRDLSKSRSYVNVSAPAIVRTALPRLRAAGVNAALLDRITADLNAKNMRGAVEGYDMAVSLSEKTVTL